MRLSSLAILAVTFLCAAVGSLVAASFAVTKVEAQTEIELRHALDNARMDWAEIQADGLQLHMTGTAPTEAKRFAALTVAGKVIDASRVIDHMHVEPPEEIAPPRFSVEILRNEGALSLIGLIPAASDRDGFVAALEEIRGVTDVADLLEVADHPAPEGWDAALDYALEALAIVPRSKISVEAGQVAVTAMSDSPAARKEMEAALKEAAPPDLRLKLGISAPRPVIAPFTLRFLIEDGTPRFDACSADTEEARETILAAARQAGMEGDARCTIGLGVPSPDWSIAAEQAIGALSRLGAGAVTFSDADISLVAAQGTPQKLFDSVVGELENDLPEVFALHAVLPEPPDEEEEEGPPEFTATLSPEGLVQLRGRINDALSRDAARSFAQARFGAAAVHNAARVDPDLPEGWPVRALAGLQALAQLSHGSVVVTPDTVRVRGETGEEGASDTITQLLSDKLGQGADFSVDVTYVEKLDPEANVPTPEECVAELQAIQEVRKISFEPGSATIDSDSLGVMGDIAEVLKVCGQIRLEIGGHTDSQGREVMNQQLSQARAQAVLTELRMRRVLTSSFTAKGYGEEFPIADNGTEEGREANRRIEFTLLTVDAAEEGDDSETGVEEDAASAQEEPAPDAEEAGSGDEQN